MSYIYKINNKINNKMYIGSTDNYKKRFYTHKHELNNDKHINIHLQRAWNKYGENNFEFKILEECNEKVKLEREQYYLDTLTPFYPSGYNIVKIAGCSSIGDGENHPNSKLSNDFVINIKRLLSEGIKQKDILEMYNGEITIGQLSKIASLDRWRNVGEEYNEMIIKTKRKKWRDEWMDIVIKMKNEGKNFKEIGEFLDFAEGGVRERYSYFIGKSIKCKRCFQITKKNHNSQKYCPSCAKKR